MTALPASELTRAALPPPQVLPAHYSFEHYDDLERWCSYWYQLRAALRLRPRRVLEIGSGTGVFRGYLERTGVEVLSADIDPSRRPDYLASVADLDAGLPAGERFDVAVAFQVLEHLPFADFERCLEGLARRAPWVLISLPCHGWRARLSFALGALRLSVGLRMPWPTRFRPDAEHHWELGRGHSRRAITRRMQRYFVVEDRGWIPENPYHYLWTLRSRLTTAAP